MNTSAVRKSEMKNNLNPLKKVFLVVPAYNEATVITDVVGKIINAGYQLIVVDDSSTDNTYQKLLQTKATVCRHPVNLGQGASLQTGINYALKQGAECIITFDADGQHDLVDVEKLIEKIDSGYDVVLGTRFLENESNIPRAKRIFLKLAIFFTKLTTQLELTDTHNGLRAFNRKAAENIKITNNRMAHASQILSEISRLKLKYCEVPVKITYTEYSMKKGQKISNSINILWESFAESWLKR